jgi:hypothetical protein
MFYLYIQSQIDLRRERSDQPEWRGEAALGEMKEEGELKEGC